MGEPSTRALHSGVLLKIVAAIIAVSVVFTIWLMATILGARGLRPLLDAGPLGIMTLLGWGITLLLGPFASVQLWRHRNSGRVAGLIVFGYGLLYYVAGFVWIRSADAPAGQVIAAAIGYAVPLAILASPQARRACS